MLYPVKPILVAPNVSQAGATKTDNQEESFLRLVTEGGAGKSLDGWEERARNDYLSSVRGLEVELKHSELNLNHLRTKAANLPAEIQTIKEKLSEAPPAEQSYLRETLCVYEYDLDWANKNLPRLEASWPAQKAEFQSQIAERQARLDALPQPG